MKGLRVAIDGPAAAGKTTAAKALARSLGYRHLDTGALYRAVAWLYLQRAEPAREVDRMVLSEVLKCFEARPAKDGGLTVNGKTLAGELRTAEVGATASKIAVIPEVRELLTEVARRLAAGGGVVVEGRDAGTVILPDAEVKFYLTATLEERAKRRHEELLERGQNASFHEVMAKEAERDERDSGRSLAPLRPADDAVVIDTTGLTPEMVVGTMLEEVNKRI